MRTQNLSEKLIQWRRDFHSYPETGFLEMRTASKVAAILGQLGFKLQLGKEVMSEHHCMGKPNGNMTKKHYHWAIENGANKEYIQNFADGYTGIVGTLDTQKEGPTIAFRFDMDALDINESTIEEHYPAREGFNSSISDKMHACGHDAHTSIGLGLASLVASNKEKLSGKIKLIFQPAEEGTRGAKSMVKADVVSDVDYFIASHIGTGVPHNHFVAANNGFLATSKMDIEFNGVASHAGGNPEEGKNALLAAANASLNIYAIPRHSEGATRINVGELHAGSGRNIIADKAYLKIESRGEDSSINEYVKKQVESIVSGAAAMYQVDYHIETVGEALSCECSNDLAAVLNACAQDHPTIEQTCLASDASAGSEDATYFIDAVQKKGGLATYCVFGTELAAGHHNELFDINEDTLLPSVEILYASIMRLNAS
ncbi:aminobenzoyl-glutamate utilization protein A [Lentibacillus halodurans]|uniref:Aminobenzoyl-glutamate utilization protein A n=1 Tax=Lentibacillus halodurans TaxID=237679 RepID=A0A1I0YE32_9BACI|nr:amidohydrolase [Lentibacillus halodurans]SFB10618.1 aminobenzoyl-glutamate utilization protein A [Lentibacillus halodurans]